jgi:DNA-binding PadR family transcriptional regulator
MRRIVTREGLLLIRQQAGRPITIADVQAETGCSYSAAYQNLTDMKKAGEAHIARYDGSFAKPVAYYELTAGKDAERPQAITNATKQRTKRVRAKWGGSSTAIDRKLAAEVEKMRASFERDVERITAEAEQAKQHLASLADRNIRVRAGVVAPSIQKSLSIIGQARAASKKGKK